MQSKLFLLALSSLAIISGDSQVRQQANLRISTTSVSCTSTSSTRAICTSTSSSSPDAQTSPSLAPNESPWRDHTEGSFTNSDRPADSTTQNERIDGDNGGSGLTSSPDQSSPKQQR